MSSMDFEIQHKRICVFTHDSEDIIIDCINLNYRAITELSVSNIGKSKVELGEINSREVAGSTGLVLFGVKGE